MFSKVIQAIEWYDAHIGRQTNEPCTMDILCTRTGKRHKNGCIGRTEPIKVYVKGLKAIR